MLTELATVNPTTINPPTSSCGPSGLQTMMQARPECCAKVAQRRRTDRHMIGVRPRSAPPQCKVTATVPEF